MQSKRPLRPKDIFIVSRKFHWSGGSQKANPNHYERAPNPPFSISQQSPMSQSLQTRIFDELNSLVLIDPHTHINPHQPASRTLADILGYHYYTELAHSAGMPREQIEDPSLDPKEKVGRLVEGLIHLDNTVQLSWLLEAGRELFDVQIDRLDSSNWESLFDAAQKKLNQPDWEEEVLRRSKLEAVFLTNDFDDDLAGFDTNRYIPCLRTDDLVFHLANETVQTRLQSCSQCFRNRRSVAQQSDRSAFRALQIKWCSRLCNQFATRFCPGRNQRYQSRVRPGRSARKRRGSPGRRSPYACLLGVLATGKTVRSNWIAV